MIGYILAGAGVLFVAYLAATYNRFVSLRNGIENSFNQIRVAMKKRMDMISQLVDTTKGYMKFEKGVLTDVTRMRNLNLRGVKDVEEAEKLAGSIFGRLLAVAENYPNLKAAETVKELQGSIRQVEEELARLRYLYNDQVQTYNTLAERLPSNIVAALLGFRKKEYLQFEGVEERPDTRL